MNNTKFHLKQIAFPREHGSWGFVIEPLALTLLIAYSFDGLLIAISAFFIFLSHQPIKVFFAGKGQNQKRKSALIIAIIYLAIVFAAIADVIVAKGFSSLVLYFIAVFLMSIYFFLELKGVKRNLASELIAPVAISILVLSIPIIENWNFQNVFSLWILLLSRTVPTIFYVHEKLNIVKQKKTNRIFPNLSNLLFLLIVIYFVLKGLLPLLSILAILILIIRTFLGLIKNGKKLTVKQIGMLEFLYGSLFVIISALGFIMNL